MKLVISIVQNDDVPSLIDALSQRGFSATVFSTTGGFLREGNSTVLIGVPEEKVDTVLSLVRENCRARTQRVNPIPSVIEPPGAPKAQAVEVRLGGAVVFVLNVERFERY